MAGSPDLKVFNPQGEYIAACKHYEDAAALAAFNGDGTTVRVGHSKRDTIWTEGSEEFPAADSYDKAAEVMQQRRQEMQARYLANIQRANAQG